MLFLQSFCASTVKAQHATRAEKIQAEREQKQASLKPEESPPTERLLNTIKDKKLVERVLTGYHGLTLVLGGLPTGQGFALGPQYSQPYLAGGKLSFRTSARYAFANAYLLDVEIGIPKLGTDKLRLDFYGLHRNSPRIDFYGTGPDTRKRDRTHFRLEDTSVEAALTAQPIGGFRFGVSGGLLRVNTGPGNYEKVVARTEDVFTATEVIGLDNQTNFVTGTVFVQLDYRDNPEGPRSGGNYIARLTHFDDYDLELHDFRRLHLEAQQYISFFNQRRVLALRWRTIMSLTNGSSTVPFYMQPYLGGPDDLRGFRAYRFYDDNQMVVNVEYRWESFTGLDMAVFADAGKVTPRRSQINFEDLESAVGFGLRFNFRNRTFLRIDTGFSHEGFQVWLKFANPF